MNIIQIYINTAQIIMNVKTLKNDLKRSQKSSQRAVIDEDQEMDDLSVDNQVDITESQLQKQSEIAN